MNEFFRRFGRFNLIMIGVVLVTIVISEWLFLSGYEMHGLFVGLWAPTILGFLNFFKRTP